MKIKKTTRFAYPGLLYTTETQLYTTLHFNIGVC